MRTPPEWPGLREIGRRVASGKTRAEEYVAAAMNAIRRAEEGPEGLNAFISFDIDGAIESARAVDAGVAAGRGAGVLAGVPVAVKDNICVAGQVTTCGSRILEGYVSPYEATVVRRLKQAGAVVVGKTNLDEFAMGSSTEHSAFGPTRNPHDRSRVAGGSSGGSVAAVAAGLVPAALGSETGGSVRQPAAFCGVVGIKPTYGRVSRYGLVAFASSLDQVGTVGRTVADAATLLEVIAGPDSFDSTSDPSPPPEFAEALESGVEGLVVGVPREAFPERLDAGVARLTRDAIERLRAAGAVIREVSLPHSRYAIPAYYILAPAEASSNLARYDGVRYGLRAPDATSTLEVYEATRSLGFGAEVKRRIMLGTYALSAGYYDQYYGRAQRVRQRLVEDFRRVFDDGVDVIATPTTPSVAFQFGARQDPYAMYLEDMFTVTANLVGSPAISVPIGALDGLPVGGQLIADRWQEATMVRAAATLERALHG